MYVNGVHPNVFFFVFFFSCVLHRKLKCSIFGTNTVPNLDSLLLLRHKELKTAFFYIFFLCIITQKTKMLNCWDNYGT